MRLSFSEKRALQKTIMTNLASLQGSDLSFQDKRRFQKEIQDAFAKLKEKLDIVDTGEPQMGPATMDDVNNVMPLLQHFIGASQLAAMGDGVRGEEGQFFKDKFIEIARTIDAMPKTYGQDGKGDDAMVYLHYFKGGSDWYITEKDQETEQAQAFGYAILNGDKQNAELGYISIEELTKLGVELDLYWSPKTLGEIKGTAPAQGKASGNENQRLSDLIAGKYNNEPPEGFLKILKEIIEEINDIEPVKPPTITYIETNQDKINSIMESALEEVFGRLWEKTSGFPPRPIETLSSPQPASDAVRIKNQDGDYGPPRKISIDIDDDFYGPTAFRAVIRAIEEARAGDTIEIKVNSNGGDTQSAQAIYVALLKTLAKTKAIIINAYSAGSIVAMACDEIEPTPFCSMMVHNASTFSGGKLGDLAGKATFLNDYFGEWYQQLYAGFLSDEELKDVIKGQDFWLKEPQIRERLKNWKPIRQRLQENGTIKAA